ncbi:MAG: iron uptake transporter permease EfeU, partial [Solirubrobacteraceae bacterium]
MSWADAVPNLLIGLREGLEAGLVVSILLAAVRKSAPDGRASTAPLWLGVVGAVAVSGSFAAVLTFTTDAVDSRAQQAVGGILSVLAVGLVTAMVFWMRRTARTLSGELRSKVDAARLIGPGALALTAFLAVGREGLETTLFLWTAVKASGETVAPLLGAALGLLVAVVLCTLLYRRAIKINLGVFFSRTALALVVIAAGVLAYGLGDLQEAGLLPGHAWVAFDISGAVAADSWWASIVTGVTELSVTMTVLQVVAYLAYLGAVVPAFRRGGRERPAPKARPARSRAGRA